MQALRRNYVDYPDGSQHNSPSPHRIGWGLKPRLNWGWSYCLDGGLNAVSAAPSKITQISSKDYTK
ncbi:MAG: hypothetical protein OHK0035_38830 [Cyanobacteria bacterium J069]